jgi:hypothetical protein
MHFDLSASTVCRSMRSGQWRRWQLFATQAVTTPASPPQRPASCWTVARSRSRFPPASPSPAFKYEYWPMRRSSRNVGTISDQSAPFRQRTGRGILRCRYVSRSQGGGVALFDPSSSRVLPDPFACAGRTYFSRCPRLRSQAFENASINAPMATFRTGSSASSRGAFGKSNKSK